MKLPIAAFMFLAVIGAPAVASTPGLNPNVSFGPGGVTFLNVEPGARVVWMTLTRERVANHSRIRIQRGLEVAESDGSVSITRAGADESRALWLVAGVDDDAGLKLDLASPGYSKAPSTINVGAAVGAATVTIESRQVELVYVRRQIGAWSISAMDGGLGDQDGDQNTVITIPLQLLQPFDGNPSAPTAVADGDLILIIDPYSNRTAVVTVSQ